MPLDRWCQVVLTLLTAGLASGHQTAHAIAHWMKLHAEPLRAALPRLIRIPSESTLLRTLRLVDVGVLQTAMAQVAVADKRNELSAVPPLLVGRDLTYNFDVALEAFACALEVALSIV